MSTSGSVVATTGTDPDELKHLTERLATMRSVPAPDADESIALRLLDSDEDLLAPDLTTDRIFEIQQQRLEAMIELGIDDRCHPVI